MKIPKEKWDDLLNCIGDNSPTSNLFCKDCNNFINDWGMHREKFPLHKTFDAGPDPEFMKKLGETK